MAIKVCQLHIYRTASLHLCYQFSDLHLCYYLCKIKYSHAASYMIVKITQNIALQGNMSCSILRSLFSYQLHHTAYYYMLKHVIAFLVLYNTLLTCGAQERRRPETVPLTETHFTTLDIINMSMLGRQYTEVSES